MTDDDKAIHEEEPSEKEVRTRRLPKSRPKLTPEMLKELAQATDELPLQKKRTKLNKVPTAIRNAPFQFLAPILYSMKEREPYIDQHDQFQAIAQVLERGVFSMDIKREHKEKALRRIWERYRQPYQLAEKNHVLLCIMMLSETYTRLKSQYHNTSIRFIDLRTQPEVLDGSKLIARDRNVMYHALEKLVNYMDSSGKRLLYAPPGKHQAFEMIDDDNVTIYVRGIPIQMLLMDDYA